MSYVPETLRKLARRFGATPFETIDVEKALGLKRSYVKNLMGQLKARRWITAKPHPSTRRRRVYAINYDAVGEVAVGGRLLGVELGEYVAFVNHRVIDHDPDLQRLTQRVMKSHRPEQVFITNMGTPKERISIGF